MTSESSLAALLLTNRLVDMGAKPLTARQFWQLTGRVGDVADLMGRSSSDIDATYGLGPGLADQISRLLDSVLSFSFERERLHESGIFVVSCLDEDFPARLKTLLGERCPVNLLIAGNRHLLSRGMRGIVGSRDADDTAAGVAETAAVRAVERNDLVVSGLARGIDQTSMNAAIEAGSPVVGIPSEGLRKVARQRQIRNLVHEDGICLVSPYGPDSPFSVANAMGRNKIIYGLATSTLVVVSDNGKGGTWEGAKEALKGGFAQVDVWTGAGATDGNAAIVALGGHPVPTTEDLWQANFERPGPSHEQLGLF